jgi:choline dehydrogenase-like flavoprotein
LFAVGPDGLLGHTWQLVASGLTGWAEWEELGPRVSGDPTVFGNAGGHLEVFAIGPEGLLGHRWQTQPDRGWSEWEDLGPAISGDPAVFQNAPGHLEVFAKGPDGLLGHMWQIKPHGGWSEWEDFGPAIAGDPAVFQNSDGRLELFAVGSDGLLGHMWQSEPSELGGWSEWAPLGPAISSPPALAQIGAAPTDGVQAGPDLEFRAAPAVSGAAELTADFCVIGAGPAGITVSDGLIRAGASVILLESGGLDDDPAAQELNRGRADGPIIKLRASYLSDGRRRQVQGSASRWGPGWCMPFRDIDLGERSWVEHGGWPLEREELAPYETRAAETFGFEAFRPPRDQAPLVRLSYRFPPDPQVFRAMYLDLLTRPRFQPELGATAVELKVRGERIDFVRAARSDGDEVRVRADTVVLAAGGVENARLLLLHDRMLPTSAMTGRCFMEHPHVLAGTVRLPDAEAFGTCLEPGPELEVLALDNASQAEERLLNASVQLRRRGAGSRGGPVDCDLYVRAEQAPNPESRVVLGEQVDRLGCAQPVLHWRLLDKDWTSIVRTAERVASILEERHGAQAQVSVRSHQPWPGNPVGPSEDQNATWGNHHMGTTRMGDGPADGTVDRDCRLQGTANLYVAGSSVFPTGSCANPTFTIVALAHRLVDHLAARAGR